MVEYLWVIGTASSAAIFVSGIISYLMKVYFTERIKASVKNEYDTKIENLRGDINRNVKIIESVLSSHNQVFNLGQGERIHAIKVLWANFKLIREALKDVNNFDQILLVEEFNTLYTDKWTGNDIIPNKIESLSNDLQIDIQHALNKIEEVRPFLNEAVWLNIVYLHTFTGRVLYLYIKGKQEKSIRHWKEDAALLRFMKDVMPTNEYDFVIMSRVGSTKAFQNFIEQKILTEINNILSGHIAAESAYNHAIKLAELQEKKITLKW